MNITSIALEGALRVLIASLVFGAGLTVVFATGVRVWAIGAGARTSGAPARPVAKVLAAVLFAVVVGGIVLGITLIVASGFGKTVSFEHVVPVLVDE